MNYNFKYNVNIQGKTFTLCEPSFYDYKNLVKSLFDTEPTNVAQIFEQFLSNLCEISINNTTSLEKFLLLLKIRGTILGDKIEFGNEITKISYSTNKIYDFFNIKTELYNHELDGINYKFNLPYKFTTNENPYDFIYDCLYSIDGNVVTFENKQLIMNELPALPVIEIYNNIIKHFEYIKMEISYINFFLNPLDESFLSFLRSIYSYDLKSMYNFEYNLRRNLNFNTLDFKTLSFPECDIIFNKFKEELAQIEKENQNVDNKQSLTI